MYYLPFNCQVPLGRGLSLSVFDARVLL